MGKIQVTVQREDRLHAINELATAVKQLALALNSSPTVEIVGNTISSTGTGIEIQTSEEVDRTEIKEIP